MLELRTEEGSSATYRLAVARSWFARAVGLMGRAGLADDEGLYLPGTNSIHMLFMRFPIDCVFVGAGRADGSREVIGVRENLAPWRGVVWWVRGAKAALELPAGAIDKSGIGLGDKVWLS